ncbi:transcription termination/antitermination protein NusA [Candidatus Woesebacteria bacterium]|nr:transcription termination/antitermination protein NusA [Candidatus Woesebacteria bacterium]
MAATPRTEFAQAIRAIASERGLDPDVILDTIKQAIVAAYKKDAKEEGVELEELFYDVELDSVTGEARIFSWAEGEEDKKKDVTPPGFGRIAAQTAKQVIHQKIREAEKGAIMGEYEERVGGLISGMILRFDGPDVRVDLGRTEGIMPADERVPNERLNPNQRMSFLLKEIQETLRGKRLVLSRSDALFVQKLFEREVPEMSSGSVEVKAIAREAGVRTKMAVFSNQSGVDPVGSCVGQKGVRVQAVTNELGGERVDIIPWNEDTAEFIKGALAPAEGLSVKLDKKTETAEVTAPEDQLSLAIGKDGQNARLAAKLTGWRIEVKSADGEVADPEKVVTAEEETEEEESTEKEVKEKKIEKTEVNIADEKIEENTEEDVQQGENSENSEETKDSVEDESSGEGDSKS